MKARKILSSMTVVAILALFALFQLHCDNDASPLAHNSELDQLPAEIAFIGFTDPESTLDDATFEKDFTIETPDNPNLGFGNDGRHKGKKPPRPGFLGPKHKEHKPPFELFKNMNLSDEQKEQLKNAAENHFQCMQLPLEQFKEINNSILEETKIARKEIMDKLKNGDITEEEAEVLLQELNEKTRQLIEENPDNEQILQAICSCNETHYQEVASILSADQLAMWDQWHSQRPNPCIN